MLPAVNRRRGHGALTPSGGLRSSLENLFLSLLPVLAAEPRSDKPVLPLTTPPNALSLGSAVHRGLSADPWPTHQQRRAQILKATHQMRGHTHCALKHILKTLVALS